MITKFIVAMTFGAILAGATSWSGEEPNVGFAEDQKVSGILDSVSDLRAGVTSEGKARRDCNGCQYGNYNSSLCANCTVSVTFGGGNGPGQCKQQNPCGPSLSSCEIGAFTVYVNATSPGCEIQWWNEGSEDWDSAQEVESGTVSHEYGDASDPQDLACGGTDFFVRCGSDFGGIKCTACT